MPKTTLRITWADGTQHDVPIMVVARSRANAYASEFDGDLERSLQEDTLPLFEKSPYNIKDWASNNMDWSDLSPFAVEVPQPAKTPNREAEWCDANMETY